ncbi:Magnesium transporter mgtE [Mycoplasmopsis bovigenitalium]|uniref:Magnesium transporter MgtE n=1 Tax=Mycoplasmopsis bovigenitalium TaxID=2112 RepID=A0A449A8M7_9BACT|nr:magnesium transporter [Mycoplasmopsis bovigenitalium]VEU60643.1 Magnesium transporter mgtE [Mycoplasmopsis bovigenitalium]
MNNNELDTSNISQKIKDVVNKKNIKDARELIDEFHHADIAYALAEVSKDEQLTFLRLIKTADAAEVFSYLETEQQTELALSFTEEWGMKLLQELQSDELADVLDELPANVTSKIIAYTPQEKRNEINKILSYAEDEVGSIMSIDISSIQNEYTCEQALYKIRRDYSKKNAELVHYYYVVSPTQKLLGALTLEEIVFAKPNAKIDDIYSPVKSLKANDKQEIAAKIFSEYDMSVLPVTNQDDRLIGMITSDDVIDVIHEAATEDIYKMAGINPDTADADDYLKTPWYSLLKSRILWGLLILLFSTVIEIVSYFLIQQISPLLSQTNKIIAPLLISLIVFIPTVSTAIRNGSTQTNITIKRALTLDNIKTKNFGKVVLKEALAGFAMGICLAAVNLGKLSIFLAATNDLMNNSKDAWLAIASVSIALVIGLTLSQIMSALVPMVYVKLKKDPSNSSLVLIQSLSELISVSLAFSFMLMLITIF